MCGAVQRKPSSKQSTAKTEPLGPEDSVEVESPDAVEVESSDAANIGL